MNNYQKKAVNYFYQGYNCAQATALAFLDETGCDQDQLARLTSSFGGGMGMQEVCGALSGALLVIGMVKGYDDPQNPLAKEAHYELIRSVNERFEKENGSVICRHLLADVEINPRPTTRTPGKRCEYFVSYAAGLVADVLNLENT